MVREAVALPPSIQKAWSDRGQDVLAFAAGLAFYAMISIVPLAIVAMWLASLIAGDDRVRELASGIAGVLPSGIGANRALLRVSELGTGLGVTAILAALWPATAYGAGLRRSFDRLSGRRERAPGLRGRGLALLLILPLLVIGTLLAASAMTSVFDEGAGRVLGWILGLVLAFVGAVGGLWGIYRLFPARGLEGFPLVRAVVFAAVGIAVLSLAFALALGLGANFKEHYAISGLAGLVLLGLWLFAANALVLFSYELARPR